MSNSSAPAEAGAYVFGERRAERPVASRSMVTRPSVPERCDVVAPYRGLPVRWRSRGGSAGPVGGSELDRWPAVSMATVELETRPPSIAAGPQKIWPRARLQRESLSDRRRMFSENRSAHGTGLMHYDRDGSSRVGPACRGRACARCRAASAPCRSASWLPFPTSPHRALARVEVAGEDRLANQAVLKTCNEGPAASSAVNDSTGCYRDEQPLLTPPGRAPSADRGLPARRAG